MPQTNYTPILIYASSTTGNTPSAGNLTNSAGGAELAINYFDGRLFYKDASNVVQVLATKGTGTIGGSNTQVQYNNNGALAGSSNMTFNGTILSVNGLTVTNNPTFNGGTANGVLYLDGSKAVSSGGGFTYNGATTVRISSAGGGYLQGAAGEILAGQDAGGFYYGNGFSVNPAIPIFIGNSGATYFESRVATAGSHRWFFAATEAMRLNSTGLGIGTSSPSSKLEVLNGGDAALTITGNTASGNYAGVDFKRNAGTVNAAVRSQSVGGNDWGELFFMTRPSGGSLTERMRLDSAGNLGLGVTPGVTAGYTTFDVNNATNGGRIRLLTNGTAYGAFYTNVTTDVRVGTIANVPLLFITDSNTRATLDTAGNLGLGVTPSAWSGLSSALQVQRASIVTSSAAAVDTYFSSNAFYDGSWKYMLSGSATQYIQNASGDHRWRVAASGTAGNAITFTQAMTLDASGNLGIGTTGPTAKLDVNGSVRVGVAISSSNTYGTPTFSVAANATIGQSLAAHTSAGAIEAPYFALTRSRGSQASPSNLLADDLIGAVTADVFNTAGPFAYRSSASIQFRADGNQASGDLPGRISFFTTPVGGSGGTERMRLDSSGNLGLGVTPGAWATSGTIVKALQIADAGSVSAGVVDPSVILTQNAYFDGTNWKYIKAASTPAGSFLISNNTHLWRIAAAGTAGNNISWTQAMTLDTSGNLGIGTTGPTARLEVNNGINNTNGTTTIRIVSGTAGADPAGFIGTIQNHLLVFRINNSEVARMPTVGGMVVGTAALATNATGGFLYVPTCAGTPTGTPTAYTGTAPIVVDTTNNKLYFYSGGQWRDAGP